MCVALHLPFRVVLVAATVAAVIAAMIAAEIALTAYLRCDGTAATMHIMSYCYRPRHVVLDI